MTEDKPKKNGKKKVFLKFAITVAIIALIINFLNFIEDDLINENSKKTYQETYTSLIKKIDNKEIKSITLKEEANGSRNLKLLDINGRNYSLQIPNSDNNVLITKIIKNDIPLITIPPSEPSILWNIFSTWGPVLLLVAIIIWSVLMQRKDKSMMKNGMGMANNLSTLVNPDDIKVSFSDVVGCDSAKEEVLEVVDFLKNPDNFTKAGAKIPRGLLLIGPAGTGKTLLAKAIAKESNVPFFSTSGSEFMEMFVGIGPARVRHLFEQAKEVAPAIIFVDEIDAIGGKRGGNSSNNSNGEREQTLNQFLVELDGLDSNKTVILIAATNRPEMLDEALLRPGRIDRQVTVDLPDVKGREEILKLYSKNIPLDKDVKFANIAFGTPGFSGAELANLVNEAAILSVRKKSQFINNSHLEEAKFKIMMGLERPNLSMTEDEKRETAYHESGHALVARLLSSNGGADPVHKVTIIPRGRALGLTLQLPEKERYSYDSTFLLNRIAILMGGRAAEEIFFNKRTAGASNDISVATSTATSMVCEWGMSKLGPIAFGERRGNQFLGGSYFDVSKLSASTALAVESEISEIINTQYERAMKLLNDNKNIIIAMTNALIEVETLDEWQIDNLMESRHYNDSIGLLDYEKRYNKKFASSETLNEPEIVDGSKIIGDIVGNIPNSETLIFDKKVIIDLS